ncbi:MAG: hypothetical protein NVSMB9_36750 [Isosphaeraceae bacterium]
MVRLRLIAYSVVGSALVLVEWTTVELAGIPLVTALVALGILLALLIAIDVTIHAWRGEGQACRNCGHIRRMKPFRVYGSCPQCGE